MAPDSDIVSITKEVEEETVSVVVSPLNAVLKIGEVEGVVKEVSVAAVSGVEISATELEIGVDVISDDTIVEVSSVEKASV